MQLLLAVGKVALTVEAHLMAVTVAVLVDFLGVGHQFNLP
jgi:hypothetical protein